MKKIFLILMLSISMVACSQTQNWSGSKKFAPNVKFLNVLQNDSNNMLLSINSLTGKPEWVDKASISSSSSTNLPYTFFAAKFNLNINPSVDPVPIVSPMNGNTITGLVVTQHDSTAIRIYFDGYIKAKCGVFVQSQLNHAIIFDIEYKNDYILVRQYDANGSGVEGCAYDGDYLEIKLFQ